MKLFNAITLRLKLFFVYAVPVSLLLVLSTFLFYSAFKNQLIERMENELLNANLMLHNMVRISVDVSIKNHLRALAEKNRDIAAYFHRLVKNGTLSIGEAKRQAGQVLLSQKIGKTGYIFVWDITRSPAVIPLAVHPLIQGRDVAYVDFVQEGARKKTGYIEYEWKNPGEVKARKKAMYLSYFKEWNWVIAVSSYRKEFLDLVKVRDFREKVLSVKYGNSGYNYVLDTSGKIIIHPELSGNYYHVEDVTGKKFIKEICDRRKGKISYYWKNPTENKAREKQATFNYISELKWVVVSSAYVEEFYTPLINVRRIIAGSLAAILAAIIIITFISGAHFIKPIKQLIEKFKEGASGNYSQKLERVSKDEIGELAGYFNVFMEKLNAKSNDLIYARNYVKNIINSLSSLLMTVDADGLIIQCNSTAESFIGIPLIEAISKSIYDLIPFLSKYSQDIKHVIESKVPAEFNRELISVDEMHRYFNVSILPFIQYDQPAAVVRLDDVTEMVKNEEQLLQAQKMETVGNLAGGLAHDFNNVLEGITGTVSLMKRMMEKEFDQSKMEKYIGFIDISAGRASDMVGQLLTLSQKYEPSFLPVDLNVSLKHIMTVCGNTFDKSVEINAEYYHEAAVADASPVQVEQVLLNLCVNAYHAMTIMRKGNESSGGVLTVSIDRVAADQYFCVSHPEAEKNRDYWLVKTHDVGVGMNRDTLDRIMDPFFSTKKKEHGTGLGLSMVYNIMKQHNGFVTVYSEIGVGSTFNIFFPVSSEAPPDEDDRSVSGKVLRGEGLILVVDDEEMVRQIAKAILEETGYRVILAEDGEEGLEIFAEHFREIKLVVLDMSMPKMSGKEAYIKMKEIYSELAVLMASGFKQDTRVRESLALGVNGFIQKPFSLVEMAEKVYKILYENKDE